MSTPQAKADIAQMIFFKELAIYAAKEKEVVFGTTHRSKHIENLFDVIYNAKNDDWFRHFDKHCEPLLRSSPKFKSKEDSVLRKELIAGFKEELKTYMKVMQSASSKSKYELRKEAVAAARTVARARINSSTEVAIEVDDAELVSFAEERIGLAAGTQADKSNLSKEEISLGNSSRMIFLGH